MRQAFRDAARLIVGDKIGAVTVVVVSTCAFAFVASTYSFVKAILLDPLPFSESGQLVRLSDRHVSTPQVGSRLSAGTLVDWRTSTTTLAAIGAYGVSSRPIVLQFGSRSYDLDGSFVTPELFEVLRVRPIAGQLVAFANEIAVSERFWRREFGGDPSIVGKMVSAEGGFQMRVAGVLPALAPLFGDVDVWIPFELQPDRRDVRRYAAVGRLKSRVTLDQARSEAAIISANLAVDHPETHDGWQLHVESLQESLGAAVRSRLWILSIAVTLMLLLVGAAFANYICGKVVGAHDEVCLRLALGATHRQIVATWVCYAAVLMFLSAVLGTVLGAVWTRAAAAMASGVVAKAEAAEPDAFVAIAIGAMGFVVSLAVAVWAKLLVRRAGQAPLTGLSRHATGIGAGGLLGPAVVVAQVSAAIPLTLVAMSAVGAFWSQSYAGTGYRLSGVLVADARVPIRLEGEAAHSYPLRRMVTTTRQLIERIRLDGSGAIAAIVAPSPLVSKPPISTFRFSALGRSSSANAMVLRVTPEAFELLGIPILMGRGFDGEVDVLGEDQLLGRRDGANVGVAIVSESVARQVWGSPAEAIGKRVQLEEQLFSERTVVGVVRDVLHDVNGGGRADPSVYLPFYQDPVDSFALLVVSSGDPVSVSTLRARLAGSEPSLTVTDIDALDNRFRRTTAVSALSAASLTALAVVSLVVGAIGAFGVMTVHSWQKRREYATKLSLGASVNLIRVEAVGQGLRLGALSAMGGVFTSIAATVVASRLGIPAPVEASALAAGCAVAIALVTYAAYIPVTRVLSADLRRLLNE